MVAQVVVDQVLPGGAIALVRREDAAVLGHIRELRAGVWHGAVAGEPAHIFRNRAAAERFVISATPRPSAWQRALDRAIAEGIDPLEVVGGEAGLYFCESASGGKGYLTTVDSCSCPAGERGVPCKHRAATRAVCGLPVDPGADPDPNGPDAGARVPAPTCRACGGDGVIHHQRLDAQRGPWTCPRCGGAGVDPVMPAA